MHKNAGVAVGAAPLDRPGLRKKSTRSLTAKSSVFNVIWTCWKPSCNRPNYSLQAARQVGRPTGSLSPATGWLLFALGAMNLTSGSSTELGEHVDTQVREGTRLEMQACRYTLRRRRAVGWFCESAVKISEAHRVLLLQPDADSFKVPAEVLRKEVS